MRQSDPQEVLTVRWTLPSVRSANYDAKWYELAVVEDSQDDADSPLRNVVARVVVDASASSAELRVPPGEHRLVLRSANEDCTMNWYGITRIELKSEDAPWTFDLVPGPVIAGLCRGACEVCWCATQPEARLRAYSKCQ